MLDEKNTSIDYIKAEDFSNVYKAMLLSGISQINFALYSYKIHSYNKVISMMNDSYKKIESEQLKKDISSLIDDANTKYINRKKQDKNMGLDEIMTYIIYGAGIYKNVHKGVSETTYRCDFSLDLNKAIIEHKIANNESKILNKIFDYHIFAKNAKEKYFDNKTYITIQKECVNAYKTIESENGKEILLKYISREFLRVKTKKKT